jgi:hypothetical protein
MFVAESIMLRRGLIIRFWFFSSIVLLLCASLLGGETVPSKLLFDGKTFAGWEGDTEKTWRIENNALTAGSLSQRAPRNEFLATTKEYANFDLRLKYRIQGGKGFINGGVQFRSQRIPNHYEMIGYQADLGENHDGALYDESRRKKFLAEPSAEVLAIALKKNEWNDYRIRASGNRIQLWLNDTLTVDYAETDAEIPQTGFIAVQIHGGGEALVEYKDLEILELSVAP